jgi:hypothetical protein
MLQWEYCTDACPRERECVAQNRELEVRESRITVRDLEDGCSSNQVVNQLVLQRVAIVIAVQQYWPHDDEGFSRHDEGGNQQLKQSR